MNGSHYKPSALSVMNRCLQLQKYLKPFLNEFACCFSSSTWLNREQIFTARVAPTLSCHRLHLRNLSRTRFPIRGNWSRVPLSESFWWKTGPRSATKRTRFPRLNREWPLWLQSSAGSGRIQHDFSERSAEKVALAPGSRSIKPTERTESAFCSSKVRDFDSFS